MFIYFAFLSICRSHDQKHDNDEGECKMAQRSELLSPSSTTPNQAISDKMSRSEGDLTAHPQRPLGEDDPRYFRLTGRPRPRRYGESYAAKIRITSELLEAASTMEDLRASLRAVPQSKTYTSNTMPRITVTSAGGPSSAPDSPLPNPSATATSR